MDHDDIQGNVLTGFNKPHQRFLMVRLPADADAARSWLAEMADKVASDAAVAKHNALHAKGKAMPVTWIGLALTWSGLVALGAPDLDVAFEDDYAFRAGAEARAADLGDRGAGAPATWRFGAGENVVDAVVTVAADKAEDATKAVEAVEALGARIPFRIEGERLTDGIGHFGFKEGGAQPVVEGPGADAKPGEFVLGEESANPKREPLPDWLRNASFQVVRVLAQDVRQWRRVAPETREEWVDRHTHKTVPDKKFAPERRRLMRRGIPYGPEFEHDPDAERGLIFNAFMGSISRQFEYVQCLWANRSDFPAPGTGPDPLIGARDAHAERYPGADGVPYARYVRTRATVYAVAPGLAGLRALGAGERHGGVPVPGY
jgi:deferrochelatase/peroxidase EfeB